MLTLVWKILPKNHPLLSYQRKRSYIRRENPNTTHPEEHQILLLNLPENVITLSNVETNKKKKKTGAMKTSLISVVKRIIEEQNSSRGLDSNHITTNVLSNMNGNLRIFILYFFYGGLIIL